MAGLPIVCPSCGAAFPVEAGMADAEARRAVAEAMKLWPAPLQGSTLVYLGLFAPAKKRLALPKLTRLIAELVALVTSGEVTRNREARAAPLQAWADGIAQVLAMRDAGKLDLPLDGHALLAEIVWRGANRQQVQHEAATRPLHPSHRPATESKEDWAEKRQGGAKAVRELLGSLGTMNGKNAEE